MGKIITVLVFKIKQYFGPLRSSRISLLLGILVFLSLNFTGFMFGIGLPDTPFWAEPDRLIDILSAFLSIFLALSLVLSLRGGVTAFQAELDFFFTSAIKPRQYVLSDLIFQFIVLHVLFSPFIPFIIGLALRLGITALVALIMVLIYETYVFLTLLIMQSLGILNLVAPYKRTKVLIGMIMSALLLPSLSFIRFFPLEYSDLPYPSTFAAKAIVHLLEQSSVELLNVYFLGIFVALAFIFHFVISRKNLFHYMRPTIMLSFFESRPQAQAIQQRRMLERFGPMTTFLTLDPTKGSLTRFLIKKHFIRIIRDGSLFPLIMLFAIYGAVSMLSLNFSPVSSLKEIESALFMLTFYSALVPSILAMSWNSYERENLWLILTSGGRIVEYFKSFFVALLIVALIMPWGLLIISLPFLGLSSLWLILSALAIASFSSAFAILTLILIEMPKEGSMSAGYFFIIFLPIIGAYMGASPFLAMLMIVPDYPIQFQFLFATLLIGYLALALFGLLKLIEKKVKSIKI
ncbi:MAG: hypothetical protein H3Z54_11640 [archaeon]|nr:hypothetical protein [archaeon]